MSLGSFAERLQNAMQTKQTPVMVGIDPQWEMLPEEIRRTALDAHGPTSEAVAAAFFDFSIGILDAVCDLVPVVKFQSAFFESAGPSGLAVLQRLNQHARNAGLLSIFDGKRNDIGSTATAYAQAYLGTVKLGGDRFIPWGFDALTVNAFLGSEGIEPFLAAANENKAGLFVLVRTSNPGAGKLQDLVAEQSTIYQRIGDWVQDWSNRNRGSFEYGPVGAVVGATVPAQLAEMRQRMPNVILLVPGFGAQGGTAADVACAFDSNGTGAIVNNSRGILYAFQQKEFGGQNFKDAARAATKKMIQQLGAVCKMKNR